MRIILLFACLAIGGVMVETISARQKRFIGGEPIAIRQASFFVSIRHKYGTNQEHWHHVCGGAFISTQHVLTAAHCLFGEDNHVIPNIIVVSDTDEDRRGGIVHHCQKAIRPLNFIRGNFSHNIAVIKLKAKVEWNEKRSQIMLPTAEPLYDESATLISFQTMLRMYGSYCRVVTELIMQFAKIAFKD